MLEDSNMEKKSLNRSSQPQSRASAVDCKKNSELTHKPWPRHNKKREAPVTPKNEPCRKNVLATRGRGQVDRRPRARGIPGYVLGGATDTGIAEEEPELGSVFVPGSKKQNLNHLLNFMYSPRGTAERNRGLLPPRRYNLLTTVKKHNQDLYLQASCQFVVKQNGDYSSNLIDPDKLIEWDQIEEILVRSTGRSECPICLGPPVAGRVGRCGHVHCWPCALHYVAAHDHQPPPCPVCAAPFRVDQMKPARMVQWESPHDEVSMRLVRRLRGSSVVEVAPPSGQISEPTKNSILPVEAISYSPYSKLFGVNDQQVHNILMREKKELQDQILAEIDTTEVVYIEEALRLLTVQEEKIDNLKTTQNFISHDDIDDVPTVYEPAECQYKKVDWFDMSGDEATQRIEEKFTEATEKVIQSNLNPEAEEFGQKDVFDNVGLPMIEPSTSEEQVLGETDMLTDLDKENKSKYFYFYQAEDGQQVFLHSLNVRMLNASWGALVAAPNVIHGRVLRRETSSLTDQIRKRMPCAAHLPIHCPFDIVELELRPPCVTPEALKKFYEEIERRARARSRVQQQERRRERVLRQMEPDLMSQAQFPPASSASSSSSTYTGLSETEPSTSGIVMSPPSGLSFAKMASTSGTWRPRAPRPPSPAPPAPSSSAPAPRAPLSLSDAIEAALQASPPAPSTSKGRNKKSKQKVLFATGMHRGG